MQDFYDIYDTTIDPMDYAQPDLYPWDMADYDYTQPEVFDNANH